MANWRIWLGVLFAGAALGLLLNECPSGLPSAPVDMTGPASSKDVVASRAKTTSEAAEYRSQQQNGPALLLAWRVVDDLDEPVPTAVVALGDLRLPCDATGAGSAVLDRGPAACRVTAEGHAAWEGPLLLDRVTTIRLRRVGLLRVRATDDDHAPVTDAEVWLASRPIDGGAIDRDPALPKAVTDANGVAVIRDIACGPYVVHARHPFLVHTQEKNRKKRHAIVIGKEPQDIELDFTMPYVAGIQIIGSEMFSCSFLSSSTGYRDVGNPDGAWACRRLEVDLEKKYPGADVIVVVRDPAAATRGYGEYLVTAWAVGRKAYQELLTPVPLRYFAGPTRVRLEDIPASDEFGGILVTVQSAGGLPVDGLRFVLQDAHRRLEDREPKIHHLEVAAGRLVTVPVATYNLTCEGAFESRIAALSRKGLQVTKGSIVEVVIESPCAWSRCRIVAKADDKAHRMTGGALLLTHKSSGAKFSSFIDHFDDPLDLWIPEGECSTQVWAYATGTELVWRCILDGVAIGGGTLETPQILRHEMRLEPR